MTMIVSAKILWFWFPENCAVFHNDDNGHDERKALQEM